MRMRTNKVPKGKDELGSELQCDSAFEPSEIYRLWIGSREEYVEGRQEDAEEFLSYVLNKLNDEMLEVSDVWWCGVVVVKIDFYLHLVLNLYFLYFIYFYIFIGYKVSGQTQC